jgi:hypothetical protein
MKASDLKKNVNKSVRINEKVLKAIEKNGHTIQSWLDAQLDENIKVIFDVEDPNGMIDPDVKGKYNDR